jgi:hypothetical protein
MSRCLPNKDLFTNPHQMELENGDWVVNGGTMCALSDGINWVSLGYLVVGLFKKKWLLFSNADCREFIATNSYQMEPDTGAWVSKRGTKGALFSSTNWILLGCLVVELFIKKWPLFGNADCRESTATKPYQMEPDRSAWMVNGETKGPLSSGSGCWGNQEKVTGFW